MVDNVTNIRDVLPLVGVIIGAVLSILGGFISTYYLQIKRLRTDRENLAKAFYGEINAILEIVKLRRYVENFNQILQQIDRTGELAAVELPIRRNYFNVYEQNVGQIGILDGELPVLIAKFYTIGNAILEDVNRLGGMVSDEWTPEIQRNFVSDLIQLFDIMQNVGCDIFAEVEKQYGRVQPNSVLDTV